MLEEGRLRIDVDAVMVHSGSRSPTLLWLLEVYVVYERVTPDL